MNRWTLGPDAVTRRVIHALESPRPKIRYPVTTPTYLMAGLKRLLPSRWLDQVLLKADDSIGKNTFGRLKPDDEVVKVSDP